MSNLMLPVAVWLRGIAARLRPSGAESGQTTAEYALVLLGVAAIALLVVAWATDSNKIGELLDSVLDSILSNVS